MTAFELRRAEWCKRTGLKPSKASARSVLRWFDKWHYPDGFDHTGVYFWPRKNIHILITEPYGSREKALESMRRLAHAHGGSFALALGSSTAGLWFPCNCFSLLIASDWAGEFLESFAMALPESTNKLASRDWK